MYGVINDIINRDKYINPIFNKKETIDTRDGSSLLIDTGNYKEILSGIEDTRTEANKNSEIRFPIIIHVGKYKPSKKNYILEDITTKICDGNNIFKQES